MMIGDALKKFVTYASSMIKIGLKTFTSKFAIHKV